MDTLSQFLGSPSFVTWLLGQSVAVVLLVAWILSLHRQLKRSSEANQALQKRNEQLSDSLVAIVQSNSRERSEEVGSHLKSVLDAFESALNDKLSE